VHGQASSVPRPPMAEDVFKNVQVLKGIPVDEFLGTMGIIAASVGRGCSECPLLDSGSDWALYAEDTPMKQVARRIRMRVPRQQRKRADNSVLDLDRGLQAALHAAARLRDDIEDLRLMVVEHRGW